MENSTDIDGKSKTDLENVVQQPPAQNIEDLDTIDERAARVEKRAIEPKQLINQYLRFTNFDKDINEHITIFIKIYAINHTIIIYNLKID